MAAAFSTVSTTTAVLALAWICSVTAYSQETVDYVGADGVALQGYIVYPSSMADIDDSTDDVAFLNFPNALHTVVVVPDWNNINDYELTRAQMIADELGYAAFVSDLYGADLHDVQDRDTKVAQATKYRSDPALFHSRINDAIVAGVTANAFSGGLVAIVGYCLGGTGVLSYSFANTLEKDNDNDNDNVNNTMNAYGGLVGAVSFHGGLMDFEVTGDMETPVLVLSGGADDAGTAVEDLEARLKSANATWQITRYSNIEHGFTDFEDDRYNEWADDRSWSEMKSFLRERFGETSYGTPQPEQGVHYVLAADADADVDVDVSIAESRMADSGNHTEMDTDMVTVHTVDYDDDEGFALRGYLAVPPMEEGTTTNQQHPAILIVPDWDGTSGPTGYEAGRAVLGALDGYVVMVADVYGSNYTDVEDFPTRMELSGKYRNDPDLFVKRIQTGLDRLTAHPAVDASMVFVTGYCLGGTGAIDYAFSEGLDNVRAVVPIHGGLTPLRAVQTTDSVKPYVMVLSGGVDDAHGNTTELELHLDAANATWEISRYSNAQHGFTGWNSPAYQPMADSRSWMSTMSLFETMVVRGSEETANNNAMGGVVKKDDNTGEDHSSDDVEEGGDHSQDESEGSSTISSADRRSAFGVVAVAATLFAALVAV